MKRFIDYIIFILIIIILLFALNSSNKERERYKSNFSVLCDSVKYYKTENGKNASSVERLILEKKELEKVNSSLSKDIKELNIKLKRIESVSQTVIENTITDTVLIEGDCGDKQHFTYSDEWNYLSVDIDNGYASFDFKSQDSLTQLIYREPHKFLFFKWGTKAIRQECMLHNPHSTIKYSQYIEIKK